MNNLYKFQKSLMEIISNHPIGGIYIAFSYVFTACFCGVYVASFFNLGTMGVPQVLIPTVIVTIVMLVASKKAKQDDKPIKILE